MNVPLKDVRPGQPVRFSAASTNAWNAAARAHASSGHTGPTKVRPESFGGIPNIRIKNDSGADVPRHGILKVEGSVFDPTDSDALAAFRETPVLVGIAPEDDPDGIFVVTFEPIPDGKIGLAYVSGIVPCKVNIVHASHTHVTMKDADSVLLDSQMYGHRILYKPTGTGEKWCYVSLGCMAGPMWVGIAQATIAPGASGNFKFAEGSIGALTAIGNNATGVYPAGANAGNLTSGDELLISRIPGHWLMSPVECPAT